MPKKTAAMKRRMYRRSPIKPTAITPMNRQPTLQETLDELVAAGLVEIKGMRDGRPVYALTDKGRKMAVHISEPPKAAQ